MGGLRANLVVKLVDQASVGEGATGHDLKVASAGSVGVEVLGLNTPLLKIACSR
jgi:hypothetical protein